MTDPGFSRRLARRIDRRGLLRGGTLAVAGGAALWTLGCASDSGDDGDNPTPTSPTSGATAGSATPGANAIKPVLLTQEFVAGADNRVAIGLLDGENRLVKDAAVHLRFFTIGEDGQTGTFRGEGDMTYVELNVEGAHVHDSSPAGAESEDSVSFYVVNAPFDTAGKWGVEAQVTPDGGAEPTAIQVPIEVRAESQSPSIGAVPPASRHDTAKTNTNAESLCSRSPACSLHEKIIADVLGTGRPLVVMFSTPAFCATRFCGPVLEVLLAQEPEYRDRIDFIHIEIWQDFQLQREREAVREWNLPGEPYTFFMNGEGEVVGKLEAVFSEEELKSALDQLAVL